MATTYKVQTQLMTTRDLVTGKRIRDAKKSRWQTWRKYETTAHNVEAAVAYATRTMLNRHIGCIVIVRTAINGFSTKLFVKIFQAKWGHDNVPFVRFDSVSGEYWRRKIQQSNPELTNTLTEIARLQGTARTNRDFERIFK